MVQTRSVAGHNAEIWESLGRLERSQLILLALSTVCAFCSVYCAVYITKSVGESSESFIELLSESFKSDRELSESFMKEMKENNSSLRESLHNLTGTVAEFYDFFEKEIQEMKASQFKIMNLTESLSVADVKDSAEFSDPLSAEFARESAFARLKKRLVADIQLFCKWMYHQSNELFAALRSAAPQYQYITFPVVGSVVLVCIIFYITIYTRRARVQRQPVVQAAAARGRRRGPLRGPDGRFVPNLFLGVCIVLFTFLSCRSDVSQ
jgi:hypothetical protein